MSFYWIGTLFGYLAVKLFGRVKYIGVENVPIKGGVLLCGNHVSYIDPPALASGVPRLVHFMAKSELFDIPLLGKFIRSVGTFPVKRNTADRTAIKTAIQYLQNGEVVAMFPEGMRSLDGKLKEASPGVGMIALKAKAVIIPVGLIDTQKLLPPHTRFFRFCKVKIIYGEPVDISDLYGQSGREAVEEVGRRVMSAIAKLLQENRNC
jgi:1-acyl-sn-glycerol-3-phosphate acyltransferase